MSAFQTSESALAIDCDQQLVARSDRARQPQAVDLPESRDDRVAGEGHALSGHCGCFALEYPTLLQKMAPLPGSCDIGRNVILTARRHRVPGWLGFHAATSTSGMVPGPFMTRLFAMSRLELKLPPPLITLLAAALCWLVAATLPQFDVTISGSIIAAGFLGLAGLITGLLGVVSVWRAGTTIEPTRPEASSSLVTSGVYRVTRNPMYLGLAILLLGWLIFLSNIAAFLILPCFVAYMTRFQIIPEERALEHRFPDQFQTYRRTVRRWI